MNFYVCFMIIALLSPELVDEEALEGLAKWFLTYSTMITNATTTRLVICNCW